MVTNWVFPLERKHGTYEPVFQNAKLKSLSPEVLEEIPDDLSLLTTYRIG
jgi:hypothetical protein